MEVFLRPAVAAPDNRDMRIRTSLPAALTVIAAWGCSAPGSPVPCGSVVGREEGRLSLWPPPSRTAAPLTECAGEISGDAPARRGALKRWDGEALAEWERRSNTEAVTLRGPEIPPEAGEATRLLIVLTPGGAREVRILPMVRARQSEESQRSNRTIIVGLERDAPPDEPVSIRVDLTAAVRDNWGDAVARRRYLERIELSLPGASGERVRLLEVLLAGEGLAYEEAAAGTRRVEIDGLVRPSWYVNPGARTRLRVRIPREHPELRWHDAALGGGPQRVVRLIDGGDGRDLWRSGGSGSGWSLQRVDLAEWAGRDVAVELAADPAGGEEAGVAFFGDPRVVGGSPAGPAGVVLFMIDNLRADRVHVIARSLAQLSPGAGGAGSRSTTPTLDGLGSNGTVFSGALSTSPWTKPAIPTLLTGIWPTTHRVGSVSYSDRLPDSVPVIQGSFRTAGWRTASFSASPLGSSLSALGRGFGLAAPPRRWRGRVNELLHPSADQLHEELLAWIDEEPDLPFFAYVHTLEVHSYRNSRYAGTAGDGIDGYGKAVVDADRAVGDLVSALQERGRHAGVLFVFVSDHGESFGAHGARGHGGSLYQSEIHIPLIFAGAALAAAPEELAGLTVATPVSLADVAPTLTELAGLPRLPGIGGRSLAPYIFEGKAEGDAGAPAFLPSALLRYVHNPDAPRQDALVTRDGRKVLRIEGGAEYAFDLREDPLETTPLPGGAEDLSRMLDGWIANQEAAAAAFAFEHGGAAPGVLDADEAERLRSLGYLE